ncbi:hypothetical protein ACJX0J_017015, partial [Zea mays]
HRPGRAAGAAQPHAAPHRVQGHQRHPRPPPEGVRWRSRVLLRRPRARRQGLSRRVRRSQLQGAAGSARQCELRDARGRPERAPAADGR